MSGHAKRYRAFISYSQKDKAYARRIHRALENYRLPRGVEVDAVNRKARKLGRVFRDDDEMGAATDLGAALQGAIADAENLIVVCSPNAAKSRWVNEEIIHFKRTARADRIFAVIVDGEPTPSADRLERECFPPALRFAFGPDGAMTDEPAEPLGLDLRKERFSRLVARLAAGLVRTPFDALWKREQRRARARTASILFSLTLAILAIGIAITQNTWRPQLHRYLHYTRFANSSVELADAPAGTTFQDCQAGSSDCPQMVLIPEGTFLMGSPDEGEAQEDERPQREISVRRFAVSQNEITFANWEACVVGGGCRGTPEPSDGGWGGGNRPVIYVSWEDARDYAQWLSRMTGYQYRLMAETEWEYAARGVTSVQDARNGQRWSFGNDELRLGQHAWFANNSEGQTHEVGTRVSNAFGLRDMHGNVWEWVEDCYRPYDASRGVAGSAADFGSPSDSACSSHVLRGGAWDSEAFVLRSANRAPGRRTGRVSDIGFRVARTIDMSPPVVLGVLPGHAQQIRSTQTDHTNELAPSASILSPPASVSNSGEPNHATDLAPNALGQSVQTGANTCSDFVRQADELAREVAAGDYTREAALVDLSILRMRANVCGIATIDAIQRTSEALMGSSGNGAASRPK